MKHVNITSKLCIRCNRVLPLAKFYPNRGWVAQSYRDAWCMDCAKKYCVDKETLEQYCYENNRLWKDSFWDVAMKKAMYVLASNPEYVKPNTGEKKKERLMNETAALQFFSIMNLKQYYSFTMNVANDGSFAEDKQQNFATEEAKKKHTYNKTWCGYFTEEEIEKLEDTYSQYEEDFVLDTVNLRDYARKVAKASLDADIARDRARRGEISNSDYKEAQRIFDDLSKSANFAACKRKPGEASGMGSLGEIIMRLEVNGELNENGFTFPEDDIDKIIADFRHTLASVGAEGHL